MEMLRTVSTVAVLIFFLTFDETIAPGCQTPAEQHESKRTKPNLTLNIQPAYENWDLKEDFNNCEIYENYQKQRNENGCRIYELNGTDSLKIRGQTVAQVHRDKAGVFHESALYPSSALTNTNNTATWHRAERKLTRRSLSRGKGQKTYDLHQMSISSMDQFLKNFLTNGGIVYFDFDETLEAHGKFHLGIDTFGQIDTFNYRITATSTYFLKKIIEIQALHLKRIEFGILSYNGGYCEDYYIDVENPEFVEYTRGENLIIRQLLRKRNRFPNNNVKGPELFWALMEDEIADYIKDKKVNAVIDMFSCFSGEHTGKQIHRTLAKKIHPLAKLALIDDDPYNVYKGLDDGYENKFEGLTAAFVVAYKAGIQTMPKEPVLSFGDPLYGVKNSVKWTEDEDALNVFKIVPSQEESWMKAPPMPPLSHRGKLDTSQAPGTLPRQPVSPRRSLGTSTAGV